MCLGALGSSFFPFGSHEYSHQIQIQKKLKANGENDDMEMNDKAQIVSVGKNVQPTMSQQVTLDPIASFLDQKLDPVRKLARELPDDFPNSRQQSEKSFRVWA